MTGLRRCALFLLIAMPGIASAHSGSMEDQMACTPDVYRFCASQIPDEDAIVACLNQHKAGLSTACAKVFSRPNPPKTGDDDDN